MNQLDQAIETLITWFRLFLAGLLGVFGLVERFMRSMLVQLHVPDRMQDTILIIVAVVLIAAVLRLFGGVFRILLIVFLILLILRVLEPALGF